MNRATGSDRTILDVLPEGIVDGQRTELPTVLQILARQLANCGQNCCDCLFMSREGHSDDHRVAALRS